MSDAHWTARRILTELCDAGTRKKILTSFWKHAEPNAKLATTLQLAKALHFREETIRKAPAEKKAEWMMARIHAPELHEPLEMGLMAYHTSDKKELLAAFLDEWSIPHVDGTIEAEEYRSPSVEEVRAAAEKLKERFDQRDIRVYLAAAGLLMGGEWREATWPVVDEMA